MKLALLLSGGKDSLYAMYLASQSGNNISVLITMVSERDDSYMFHIPAIELTKLQAEAMQIPHIYMKTKGEKEKELNKLKEAIKQAKKQFGIGGIVSGAVASQYQKQRIDTICKELGLKSFAPLWHKEPLTLMHDVLNAGFRFILSGVAAEGLDESWLGKEIDEIAIKELEKKNIHICGEGGEFETLVLDCPLFKKKIKLNNFEKVWETNSGYIKISNTELVEK